MRYVANGFFEKMSSDRKNTCTTMIVATTKPIMSRWRRWLTTTATAENSDSTRTQNSSEPSRPPQNAVTLYQVSIVTSEVSATYFTVKSWVTNA